MDTLKAKGSAEMGAYRYRVQVSPLDCTGCEVCVLSCPDDALSLKPLDEVKVAEGQNFEFATAQPNKGALIHSLLDCLLHNKNMHISITQSLYFRPSR
jgi:ferredoxin